MTGHRMLAGLLPMLLALLSACGAGGSDSAATASALQPASYPAEPVPEARTATLCSWPLVSDPDFLNVALPDQAATYWIAALPSLPDTRLRIEGQYPNARYFSFNAYSPLLAAVDALTDYQIAPRQTGTSRYRDAGAAPGAHYLAYLLPEPPPEPGQRAANTLYSGALPLGLGLTVPANPLMILIYRIYLAETDLSGGVPLPTLTVETSDGAQALLRLEMTGCTSLPPPELLPDLLTEALREQSPPAALMELFATQPLPVSPTEPALQRAYGLPETLRANLSAGFGFQLPGQAVTSSVSADLLNNLDNAYLQAILTRDKGSMYLIRGRAPRAARDPVEAPLGTAQLRYWSLCTNEILTQRFTDCLYDHQVPLDKDGYFTVVVSDADQRPANVTAENGMAWLAWGAIYPDSTLLYRHMLPSARFPEAIQNIPLNTPPEQVMGSYYPLLSYCDRATVEAAGEEPAAVFAACRARGENGSETSLP